mmetsp:Transcript_919/g.1443  ORF Transcript_919/g.1443 Transcript_919/m.1443 type:complete len:323 (+) Transcript_919:40-1008(+)
MIKFFEALLLKLNKIKCIKSKGVLIKEKSILQRELTTIEFLKLEEKSLESFHQRVCCALLIQLCQEIKNVYKFEYFIYQTIRILLILLISNKSQMELQEEHLQNSFEEFNLNHLEFFIRSIDKKFISFVNSIYSKKFLDVSFVSRSSNKENEVLYGLLSSSCFIFLVKPCKDQIACNNMDFFVNTKGEMESVTISKEFNYISIQSKSKSVCLPIKKLSNDLLSFFILSSGRIKVNCIIRNHFVELKFMDTSSLDSIIFDQKLKAEKLQHFKELSGILRNQDMFVGRNGTIFNEKLAFDLPVFPSELIEIAMNFYRRIIHIFQ